MGKQEQWAGDRTPPKFDAPVPRHIPEELIDESEIHRPPKGVYVWVTLTYPDQKPMEIEGIAGAWTKMFVKVGHSEHVEYYSGWVTRWYPAFNVRRRHEAEQPEFGRGGKWQPARNPRR
ncbi:hypothetical protein [Psychromicrobium lacuslunae]|uniref:Uncharacterized protein n=1 Tax=Psychromicrobium lacuslunae TaxID=1618207 RepID=A0A0D4C1Y9_9MICC|nr:hypothetical protein [Psychromicrobium lacuslunae]AJT42430.1 hypothetical protein UM93_14680 [Psychromicrobium lacuslunae]